MATATATADRAIGELNALLRGEISAVETYTQASRKLEGAGLAYEAALLRSIELEHGRNAQLLREEVKRLGGEADNASGVWGAWAKTVEAIATLLGDAATLKTLKEGEEVGLHAYWEAVDTLDESPRKLVLRHLIPAQGRHIALLEEILAETGTGSGMASRPASV